jgi:inorganic pyrophosphatase
MVMDSKSLKLAKQYLGKKLTVTIDRKLGSKHPQWGFEYPINYGYLEGVIAPDGEGLDAYLLKIKVPVEAYEGIAVAIVHRLDDDDDKLVIVPEGQTISDEEIEKMVEFQEKWYRHQIVR